MSHVIENVSFRLKPDSNVDGFLKSNEAVDAWLSAQPGFVTRTLSEGEGGMWLDHVEWATMDAAKAAADAMMKEATLAPFASQIDETTVQMRHNTLRWKR